MLEITSGVPSGVRESDENVTPSENVTTNTTLTVNSSPGPQNLIGNISTDEDKIAQGTEYMNASASSNLTQNENNKSLESYRSMGTLVDNDEDKSKSEDEESDNTPVETVTRSGRVLQASAWHSNYAVLALTNVEMEY